MGQALADANAGVFELAPAGVMGEDLAAPASEMDWMRRLAEATGRPITFALSQHDQAPDQWKELLDLALNAWDAGIPIRPQIAGRPTGLLLGLQTFHPLLMRPSYQAIAHLPLAERVAEMKKPAVRKAILSEKVTNADDRMSFIGMGLDRVFPIGNPPDYEPAPETSIAAQAERLGVDQMELFYDLLLEDQGASLLVRPLLGYSNFSFEPIREMLLHPTTALGLGDGGAHVGAICDASIETTMLVHWARDRTRGAKLPLELVVRKMTSDTASLYGLNDRGVLASGYRADVNVIDFKNLRLDQPKMVHDLPGGARRLLQKADGYRSTFVAGTEVMHNGVDTGARPGQLVRGAPSL